MSKKWKNKNFGESFDKAIEGIFEAIRTERQLRFYAFMTILVIIFGLFYNVEKTGFIALSIAISLVWLAELINTAIEACVDIYCEEYHELARKAKDVGAAAVLVTVINALTVGYFVFEDFIRNKLNGSFLFLKSSYQHRAIFIIFLISVVVIILKKKFGYARVVRGGFPSGHSAISACLFVLINYIAVNSKVFFLSLILTILVLQSRIEGKIHTFKETVAGAFIGGGLTYIILYLLG